MRTNSFSDKNKVDGLVWVEDEKILVKDESIDGFPACINPCPGIKLYINGNLHNKLTVVSAKDTIEVIPDETEVSMNLEIRITDDKQKAFIKYTPAGKSIKKLKNSKPTNRLNLEVDEGIVEKKPVTKEDILSCLDKNNIVSGILQERIEEICTKNETGEYLVAVGTVPGESEDEWIEYSFDEKGEKEFKLVEDSQGRVDYRNIFDYETVKPGDILAKVHPGKQGEPGTTVTGEPVLAPEPKSISIVPNHHISYDESSGIVSAKISGKPSKSVSGNNIMFNINERLAVKEVSLKTGNVRFTGDIDIAGNIYDSMEVNSTQNVFIQGNVSNARIIARKSIIVKGSIISSKIYAGTYNKNPTEQIEKIINEIKKLIFNIENFSKEDAEDLGLTELPDLVLYLLNMKNKSLPETIYSVLKELRQETYGIDKSQIILIISKTRNLLGDCNEIADKTYLEDIISFLRTLCDFNDNQEVTAEVSSPYILNSEVSALNDILITEKGCFNSNIKTDGNIYIRSVVFGSELSAGKNIEANTCGSELGVKTFLTVPSTSKIFFSRVYPDTTVRIGNQTYTFLEEKHQATIKLKDDKISII